MPEEMYHDWLADRGYIDDSGDFLHFVPWLTLQGYGNCVAEGHGGGWIDYAVVYQHSDMIFGAQYNGDLNFHEDLGDGQIFKNGSYSWDNFHD